MRGVRWVGAVATLAVGVLAACGDGESPQEIEGDPIPEPAFGVPGSWDGRGGLREPLTGVAAAVWRDHLYVVGGYADAASGPATRHVVRFELATGTRTVLNDYPDEVAEGAMVVYRDTLLMIGGNAGNELSPAVLSDVRWYDEAADSWKSWSALPERRFRHTAHVVGDRLFVIGGRNTTQPPGDSIVVFDGRTARYGPPPNRTWTEPMAGGVIGDTVFAITSSFDSRVLRYDGAGEDWAESIGHPLRATATGGVLAGRLHAFSFGPGAEHRVWDPATSTWLTAPLPSNPVERGAVVEAGGRLWLIGGHDSDRVATNRMQIFTPS